MGFFWTDSTASREKTSTFPRMKWWAGQRMGLKVPVYSSVQARAAAGCQHPLDLVCSWCWSTLTLSPQVQPSPFPEHLHLSPSYLKVPLAPAVKANQRLETRMSLSASPSPSTLPDHRKMSLWCCFCVFLQYKFIQYVCNHDPCIVITQYSYPLISLTKSETWIRTQCNKNSTKKSSLLSMPTGCLNNKFLCALNQKQYIKSESDLALARSASLDVCWLKT